jgi:hypothetical protein
MSFYRLVDLGFIGFHTTLILFNLLGWIWPRTRKLNLFTLLATGCSWFILGIWYGWGYCFCTDWHWQIRRAMGDTDLPNSYISFLVEIWTGFQPDPYWVDLITLLGFLVAILCSLYVNIAHSPSSHSGSQIDMS